MFIIRLLMIAIPLQFLVLTVVAGFTFWPAIKLFPAEPRAAKRVASLIYDGLFQQMIYFYAPSKEGTTIIVKGYSG